MKYSYPKIFLHLEGLVIFGLATILYFKMLGAPWMYFILLLAPDIGILGYTLKNKKVASLIYNIFHTYSFPFLLGVFALTNGLEVIALLSLIWMAHIGLDRLFGFGLKFQTHFKDTHLQRLN